MTATSTAASSTADLSKSKNSSVFDLHGSSNNGHGPHPDDIYGGDAVTSSSGLRLSEIDRAIELRGPGLTPPESFIDRNESQLPPVDTGKDAWLFLAACFAMEALVWGFAFTFGIFQDYYSTHEPFKGEKNIAVVGTMAMVPSLLSPHHLPADL